MKKDEIELERMAEIINYISGKLMDDGNSPELIAGVLAACSLSIYRSILNDEEYESMIDEISKCRDQISPFMRRAEVNATTISRRGKYLH